MRSFEERKTEIKNMPTKELRRRYHEGRFGELRPFVEAELIERDSAEKSAADFRAEEREDEAISIAREDNRIALQALSIARRSERWAMYAAIIATVALVIATKDQIFKFIFNTP